MGEPSYSVPEGVAHDVIVKECAALVRWGMGDPSGFLGICAPESSTSIPACFDASMDFRR